MHPLTDSNISHYHREGYVLVRGLIPAQDIAALHRRIREACTPPPGVDRWTPVVFDHQKPDQQRDLHALLVAPRVIDAVEQLLGPAARVFYGMIALVPGQGGRGLPWHQDNQYHHVLHHALNTFIAVSDIAENQAQLWVVPQSHRRGLVASKEASDFPGHRETLVDEPTGIRLPALSAGDACIFNRNTVHRSLNNQTDRLRVAYAAQYIQEDARDAQTGRLMGERMTARSLAKRWSRTEVGAGTAHGS